MLIQVETGRGGDCTQDPPGFSGASLRSTRSELRRFSILGHQCPSHPASRILHKRCSTICGLSLADDYIEPQWLDSSVQLCPLESRTIFLKRRYEIQIVRIIDKQKISGCL